MTDEGNAPKRSLATSQKETAPKSSVQLAPMHMPSRPTPMPHWTYAHLPLITALNVIHTADDMVRALASTGQWPRVTIKGHFKYNNTSHGNLPDTLTWRYWTAFTIEDLYIGPELFIVQPGADCHMSFDTLAVRASDHAKFISTFNAAKEWLRSRNNMMTCVLTFARIPKHGCRRCTASVSVDCEGHLRELQKGFLKSFPVFQVRDHDHDAPCPKAGVHKAKSVNPYRISSKGDGEEDGWHLSFYGREGFIPGR